MLFHVFEFVAGHAFSGHVFTAIFAGLRLRVAIVAVKFAALHVLLDAVLVVQAFALFLGVEGEIIAALRARDEFAFGENLLQIRAQTAWNTALAVAHGTGFHKRGEQRFADEFGFIRQRVEEARELFFELECDDALFGFFMIHSDRVSVRRLSLR